MWRYITQLPGLYSQVRDLVQSVQLLTNRAGRTETRMNATAQLIEDQTKLINQHNADDLAYQGQVNAKFAKLQATIDALPGDTADVDAALLDLKAATAAMPALALPPDNPVTQTMLTTPAAPAPIEPPATIPVFPGVPPAPDTNAPEPAPIPAEQPIEATPLPASEPIPAVEPAPTTDAVQQNNA